MIGKLGAPFANLGRFHRTSGLPFFLCICAPCLTYEISHNPTQPIRGS